MNCQCDVCTLAKIHELASISDLLTVEIEHVDTTILSKLVGEGYVVQPHPSVVAVIQDKFQQKKYLQSLGIPLPEFIDTPTLEDAIQGRGFMILLKIVIAKLFSQLVRISAFPSCSRTGALRMTVEVTRW